jgi:methyl-accepting chemotaxis protein
MATNMKTGTKVLFGFGFATVICLIVGIVGYQGIGSLRTHTEDLGAVRIPNMQGLALIEQGQMEAGYGLRGLTNPRMMDAATRMPQYDRVKAGLDKVVEGLKIYEPLPQTQEEEAQWKQYRPTLSSWQETIPKAVAASQERDRLVTAGTRTDDKKVLALEDEAYRVAATSRELIGAGEPHIRAVVGMNARYAVESLEASRKGASAAIGWMIAAIAIGAITLLALGFFLSSSIGRVLRTLITEAEKLAKAAIEGKLATRANPELVAKEFQPIVIGVNNTLDAVVTPLNVAAKYVDDISRGAIPPKITDSYNGDFNTIKNNLNTCIDAVSALVADANMLSKAAVEGKLATRADASKHQGDFRKIVQGVDDCLDAVIGPLNVAAKYVDDISKGNIPPKITDNYNGDFNLIKNNLNTCIDAVNALVADAKMLSAAAVEGKLATRADATRHQGDFRKVVDGVNQTLDAILAPVTEASNVLEKLAQKDLCVRMAGQYQGDNAKIKESLNATAESLHEAMNQVAQAADQVSSAAGQIASSSQTVADGASQQASALEETSSSLESMNAMVRRSADNAQQANALSNSAKIAATGGAAAVEQMTVSMGKIRASAEGTSQIIKDINEIAFQTNLLALNAAVEAARAGEAGRGFAVVAEEVRSLALRSKEAAMKTEELIRESVRQAAEGEETSKAVSTRLTEIVDGVTKVSGIISEISASAKEQAAGVEQINRAIGDMNKVTQQNAANSEESSSAAAELSSQSEELASMVSTFSLNNSKSGGSTAKKPTSRGVAGNGHSHSAKKPGNGSNGHIRTPEELIPLEDKGAFREF